MKYRAKDNSEVDGDHFIGSKSMEFINFRNNIENSKLQESEKLSDKFTSFYINPILSGSTGNEKDQQLLVSSVGDPYDIDVTMDQKVAKDILTSDHTKKLGQEASYVFINTGNKLVKVVMDSILFIYTDSKNYCSLATSDNKKVSVRSSIHKLYKLLDNDIFVRTHRSYLINWKMVDTIFESDQTLQINGHHIPIGRTYKKDIYAKLNII